MPEPVQLLLALILIIVLLLAFGGFILKKLSDLKNSQSQDQTLVKWLQSMQQSLEQTNLRITSSLSQTNKNITDSLNQSAHNLNRRLDSATNIVSEVSKELGKMNELGNSMRQLQLLLQS